MVENRWFDEVFVDLGGFIVAKLRRRVRTEEDRKRVLHAYDYACEHEFSGEPLRHFVSEVTPQRVVEVYKSTGEYYDIDYPGGIEQFVEDYDNGIFDEG